jgi:hypothetical protein
MLDLQFGRIADERRDLVTLRERLLDKFPTRPASCADDQQPQWIARLTQGPLAPATGGRLSPEQCRQHQRVGDQDQEKSSKHCFTVLSCVPPVWEI